MTETAFFFPGPERDLYGVLHRPAAAAPSAAVLFCSPFGEEKLWAHLVYANFARELARRGAAVLRFDYRGTGDSDGDTAETTPEACLADIACAARVLRDCVGGPAPLGLLGLRFGATLAAVAAARDKDVSLLALWSPIMRGGAYADELLRMNLAVQMAQYREVREDRNALLRSMREGKAVNVDGYELTLAAFEEMSAVDLSSQSQRSTTRCLVAQIASRKPPTPDPEYARLAASYPAGEVVVCVEEPFWKEIRTLYSRAERLSAETSNWFEAARHGL